MERNPKRSAEAFQQTIALARAHVGPTITVRKPRVCNYTHISPYVTH
jgi:hypothetical protein